jgi:hypothetical protein
MDYIKGYGYNPDESDLQRHFFYKHMQQQLNNGNGQERPFVRSGAASRACAAGPTRLPSPLYVFPISLKNISPLARP